MNKDGWIKLWRKIEDNPIWFSEPFSRGQAWIDLLLLANSRDNDGLDSRHRPTTFQSGVVYRSISELAERWKWSRGKVTRFLKNLEVAKMINLESDTTNGTRVAIYNWKEYQQEAGKRTSNEQQTDIKRTTDESKTIISKNNKEIKEKKEKEKESCVAEGAALQEDANRLTEIPDAYKERFGDDIEAFRKFVGGG